MAKIVGPSGRLVESVPVDFEQNAEPWVSVELTDGSTLKVKTVISGVTRYEGEHDAAGNPIYYVQTAIVVRVTTAGKGLRGEPTIVRGAPKTEPKSGDAGYA